MSCKYIFLFLIFLSFSCQREKEVDAVVNTASPIYTDDSHNPDKEEESITIQQKLQPYSFSYSNELDKRNYAFIASQDKFKIQSWWKSLPTGIKNQIKNNEISINLSNSFKAKDDFWAMNTCFDERIENTGNLLDRIAGNNLSIQFSINAEIDENCPELEPITENETEIQLIKTIKKNLSDFNLSLYPQLSHNYSEEIRNWWHQLPQEVQNGIKDNSIFLQVNWMSVQDQFMQKQISNLLQDLIGFAIIDGVKIPLGEFKISQVSKAKKTEKNQLKFALKKNKKLIFEH
jgi:L-rhamnose mutarotase